MSWIIHQRPITLSQYIFCCHWNPKFNISYHSKSQKWNSQEVLRKTNKKFYRWILQGTNLAITATQNLMFMTVIELRSVINESRIVCVPHVFTVVFAPSRVTKLHWQESWVQWILDHAAYYFLIRPYHWCIEHFSTTLLLYQNNSAKSKLNS